MSTEIEGKSPVESARAWEELVSTGMQAREMKDKAQWVLGDLALQIETFYGMDAIGKYATEIGVNKETLKRYRSVSKAWLPEERVDILSHRHHQILAGKVDKHAWAEKAADNTWSCEKLQVEMMKMEAPDLSKTSINISFEREDLQVLIHWYEVLQQKVPDEVFNYDTNLATILKNKLTALLHGKA